MVTCVSRAGLLVRSDGTIRGGRGESDALALIGRKEKLDEMEQEVARLDGKVTAAQEQAAANRARREELREALIAGRGRLAALDTELSGLQVQLAQAVQVRDTAGQRAAEMQAERERLSAEVAALATEEQQLTDLLTESGRLRLDSTTARDELRRQVQQAELSRDELRAEVEELRLTHQRREGQQRETRTTLNHLRENVAEQFARRERLAQDNEHARESMAALGEELAAKRDLLARGMDDRERRRKVVRAAADGIQAMHEETAAWHQRVQAIEKQRGGYREQAHEMQTLLATLEIKRNNLEERIEQQYKGSFRDLVAGVDETDLPPELERQDGVFQLEQARSLLEDRREKLNALGPINHLALEEYDTKKERLDFLEAQRDDVEKARGDLQKAIAEINRTARKRFVQTFEEVRRNYIAVFQTLFKGGRADLQLIKTDDPLESNLHIIAQPTGKVVDHVSLLSGGERCLTALSLLFAVYLVKPSPFCMLDEADAPLDDSNIQRFVTMLREFSRNTQFLVITHNKLTMETANHLYGVTMMEPGCSSIVSVSFSDVAESRSDEQLAANIAARRQNIDQAEAARGGQGAMAFVDADAEPDAGPETEAEVEAEAEPAAAERAPGSMEASE
ncbi:MAG: hypothetical protein IH621_00170 [Krumholzibacteria bacterium]|nr:hypothetical protein [Candidatus Krumholzibacteria bacterium]